MVVESKKENDMRNNSRDNKDNNKSVVTPWNVEGKVDYDKLIKEFGLKYVDENILKLIKNKAEEKNLPLHLFLRRKLFFSHRDFDLALKEYFEGKKFFLYTGRAPGGKMHLGHLIPFLFVKYLQDVFDVNLYIQIPDDEKFLFKKNLDLETVRRMTDSDLLDIAALNFDEDKTFIFKNSEYIKNMYPLFLKTSKKINFSTVKATFGFNNESNIGMISYPALQIIPTFFEKNRVVIPCAIDQDPYFRLQRDIAESLGFKKNVNIHSKFLIPLTGFGKMSSSEEQKAILLTDDEKTVKKKINKYAFSGGKSTVEEHRKYGGNADIDVSFQWLYFLFEEDDNKILKIKEDYESGRLLSGELKSLLIEKIVSFLKKHSENKKKILEENKLEKYMYSGVLAKKMWKKTFL